MAILPSAPPQAQGKISPLEASIDYIDGRGPYPKASDHLPLVLSKGWKIIERGPDGFTSMNYTLGLACITTLAIERDGNPWKHISISRRDCRIPDYLDIQEVRRQFVKADEHAYMIWPPRDEYVNISAKTGVEVLHLFIPIGHRPLPDFRVDREGSGL